MKQLLFIATLLSFNTLASGSGDGVWPGPSFGQAKGILKSIYKVEPTTFYCGCNIVWESKKKLVPNASNCSYEPRNKLTKKGKVNKRAKRIEWEHVVPAWEFGHQMQCWQDGGRKSCKKVDKFKKMEGDLHNLVPAIGEINGDRSNFKFSMIEGEDRVYGQCDAEVNFKARMFEPAPEIRGNIARTYFYFEQKYGLKISKQQRKLYSVWDKQDPIDSAECQIHKLKAAKQGWGNSFVQNKCK